MGIQAKQYTLSCDSCDEQIQAESLSLLFGLACDEKLWYVDLQNNRAIVCFSCYKKRCPNDILANAVFKALECYDKPSYDRYPRGASQMAGILRAALNGGTEPIKMFDLTIKGEE